MKDLEISRAEHDTFVLGTGWICITRTEDGLVWERIEPERVILLDAGPWLCSQCGELPAVMVKIGTCDGWCTRCLDEAAAGEVDL